MPNGLQYFCGTAFQDDPPAYDGGSRIQYLVYQPESTTAGNKHWQFYVEFTGRVSIATAQRILQTPGAHLERRLGTAAQARDYCCKERTRISGYDPVEHGCISNPEPGKRNDIIALRSAAQDCTCLSDLINDDGIVNSFARYGRFAERVFAAAEKERSKAWRVVTVYVYWGATGTGKTRRAYESSDDLYKWDVCSPEWWDGYDGETTLLIDEFYGQLKPSRMLQLLDGYSLRLPIKGGFTYARWDTVYITSNSHPDSWYSDLVPDSVKSALHRRYSEIQEFE